MHIKKILIANRGEIAVRIIRTAREKNIKTVSIFAEDDRHSLHVTLADEAIPLGSGPLHDTYLCTQKIIDAIKTTNADAVHPGYGFLSENAAFACAVEEAGCRFIGPPPAAIEAMGQKVKARQLMTENKIPVVPGSGALDDVSELHQFINEVGLPVLLKASAGGGGRGMRQIHKHEEIETSFEACRREAKAFFNDDRVFCEKLVVNPRHIEFQILFDKHGNGVHLFERDCSIQRRHQKLFEEAPSLYLNSEQRKKWGELAVAAGKAVGYVGAGTVELICESADKAWFMEMNTRIQVEHPVTEMITGIDLIGEQIDIAEGQKLKWEQQDLSFSGWAMEARINAEDSGQDFQPSPGRMKRAVLPQGPFTRVDSHLYPGYTIPESYDSMVAKIIVWGRNREDAIARMQRALRECEFSSPTTCPFHLALIGHPLFQEGLFTTNFITEHSEYFKEKHNHGAPSLAGHALAVSQTTAKRPLERQERTRGTWEATAHQYGVLS